MKKYGRTPHLPISPGTTNDDKIMRSIEGLMVEDLLVTEKMDGENTTIHHAGTYARSPNSGSHPSRDWIKRFSASVSPNLKENERIVGENLYAKHSILYNDLKSYFMGFSWIIDNEIQSWDSTVERFKLLGITPVPILYRGPFKKGLFEEIATSIDNVKQEGFVVRVAKAFPEAKMSINMGKYVRQNHVQSEEHWTKLPLTPNHLSK